MPAVRFKKRRLLIFGAVFAFIFFIASVITNMTTSNSGSYRPQRDNPIHRQDFKAAQHRGVRRDPVHKLHEAGNGAHDVEDNIGESSIDDGTGPDLGVSEDTVKYRQKRFGDYQATMFQVCTSKIYHLKEQVQW